MSILSNMQLALIKPTKNLEQEIAEYKQEHFEYGDEKIHGSGGLAYYDEIHHSLIPDLANGGHIAYGIRPSERGKGYGKQQLQLLIYVQRPDAAACTVREAVFVYKIKSS